MSSLALRPRGDARALAALCPHCGCCTDAPRGDLATGRTGRKCRACLSWTAEPRADALAGPATRARAQVWARPALALVHR
jgi:hypothetical protein